MTESVRILNKQREDTGIRRQRGRLEEGDLVEVVHLWVKSPQGRHLLQKRSASKSVFPMMWDSAAAGAVREHESPAGAAVREAGEELGIAAREEDLQFLFTAEFEQGFDDYYLLTIDEETPLQIQAEEVSRAEWFDTEEVLDLIDDALFTEHEGTRKMEALLREQLLESFAGEEITEISACNSHGTLLVKGIRETLVFEGILSLEGSLAGDAQILKSLACEMKGKRQNWTLSFSSSTLVLNCSRVERRENEYICPVCGSYLKRGAVYADRQINWTPATSRVGAFSRPTRWSMGKEDVKLADYFIMKKAEFPLHYCERCRLYLSKK